MAPFAGVSREFVKRNIGFVLKADNSKSINELGLTSAAIDKAVIAMFEQMHRHKHFE
ncbi:MAG: hypothetical protein HRU20_24850 [Pseudomonadales bacterium]|nr:hypothetical protein [Pseudomonadales bacterium]